jgi:hypothetical protein
VHRRGFNTTDDENANENLTLNECKIKHTISKSILILLLLLATTSIGHFASKPNSGFYKKPKTNRENSHSTMKISAHVAKNLSANQFKKNGMQPVPIPYDRQERSKDKDNEDVSVFRIRTNPTDKDSQTYDIRVLTFHTGTVEEFLLWKKDLFKILVGQNVLSAPDKFAMTRRLLDGDALAAFDAEASLCSETEVNYTRCMKALSTHVFPKNALTIQRQWFHRYLHKRVENSMREFVARINEINAYMEEFPPGFKKSQTIDDSEMKDLLEFAIPISWRVKMAEHAFRPIEHTVPEIVEFCERLEFTENATKSIFNNGGNHQNQTQSQTNNKGKNSEQGQKRQDNVDALTLATSSKKRTNKHKRPGKVVSFKDSDGSDGCRLHIWATDHTTEECRVIQKQIDGMRAQYEAQPHNANKRQKNNNNQPKSGGDLHVLIATFNDVKDRIEKELKQCSTACGKRKTVSFAEDVVVEKDDNKKN